MNYYGKTAFSRKRKKLATFTGLAMVSLSLSYCPSDSGNGGGNGGDNNAPQFPEDSYSLTNVAIAAGTAVTTVTASDADDDTLTYSITSQIKMGDNSPLDLFAIDSASGEITVADSKTLEHSTTYQLIVQVSDDDNATDSATVTVVTAADASSVNTPPQFAQDSYSVTNIATETGTVVITVTANDADSGDTLTYSIPSQIKMGENNQLDLFAIENSANGEIKVAAGKTLETGTTYQLTVQVSDDDNATDSATVMVMTVAALPPGTFTSNLTEISDAFVHVAADFDDAQAMVTAGWIATGVFASPAAAGSWAPTNTAQNSDAAVVGDYAVSTCQLGETGMDDAACNRPRGVLLSPAMDVEARYLNFLMDGSTANRDIGVEIHNAADGAIIAQYRPQNRSPAYLDGDSDWRHVDLQSQMTNSEQIRIRIYDMDDGSFIAFDHFFFSNTAQGTLVPAYSDLDKDLGIAGNTMSAGFFTSPSDAIVIARFDNPLGMLGAGLITDWTTDGLFTEEKSGGSWIGAARTADTALARVGLRGISTCEIDPAQNCYMPTGSLFSPDIAVAESDNYLNFLMSGGNGTANVGLRIHDAANDNLLLTYRPAWCADSFIKGPRHWHRLQLSALGIDDDSSIKVEIFDNESEDCGFVAADHFYLSDTANTGGGSGYEITPPSFTSSETVTVVGPMKEGVIYLNDELYQVQATGATTYTAKLADGSTCSGCTIAIDETSGSVTLNSVGGRRTDFPLILLSTDYPHKLILNVSASDGRTTVYQRVTVCTRAVTTCP